MRTLGRLRREGEALVFEWRPWLVLAKRRLTLSDASALERGFIHPVVLTQQRKTLLRCAPRYRSITDAVAERLQLPVLDQPLLRGFAAVRAWFADQSGRLRATKAA